MSEGVVDSDKIKAQVDRELMPQTRTLEAEMKAAIKKTRIVSFGSAIATGVGVLAGTCLGVAPAILLGLGATGAAAIIKSQSELAETLEKNKAHPFYFLWKAKM